MFHFRPEMPPSKPSWVSGYLCWGTALSYHVLLFWVVSVHRPPMTFHTRTLLSPDCSVPCPEARSQTEPLSCLQGSHSLVIKDGRELEGSGKPAIGYDGTKWIHGFMTILPLPILIGAGGLPHGAKQASEPGNQLLLGAVRYDSHVPRCHDDY